ncbi:MAG TPA: methyltransferase domain-containing protein [Candidatus Deferrimicrobiaceae bacterium]|jgi:malonyl-CoA O-methyltransferase
MIAAAVDKAAVARNFSEAAGSYDGWASAQAAIAGALVRRLPPGFDPARIADLGCGTGRLSELLLARYPSASLTGLDLADGMIAHCRSHAIGGGRAAFRRGDAECPSSLPDGVDLIASSCAAQWFSDLPATLRMWADALPPGGVLALATLVRGAFPELDAAHAAATGSPFPGLAFPEAAALAPVVRAAGLRLLADDPVAPQATYPDALGALRSFRKIGARVPGRPLLSPHGMRRLLAALDHTRNAAGEVTLTHRAHVLVAQKECR